jgi:hypothetical protein
MHHAIDVISPVAPAPEKDISQDLARHQLQLPIDPQSIDVLMTSMCANE